MRICQLTGYIGVRPKPGTGSRGGGANPVQEVHIYPQRLCTGEKAWRKRDPDNLLYLDARVHLLFDSANLSFSSQGRAIFCKSVPYEAIEPFVGKSIDGYTEGNEYYMKKHRKWAREHGAIFDK